MMAAGLVALTSPRPRALTPPVRRAQAAMPVILGAASSEVAVIW
jgi:ABC-type sugar transport system substrate-binding protein